MTSRPLSARRSPAIGALVGALLASLLIVPLVGASTQRADAEPQRTERRAPDTYTPPAGAKFNNPLAGQRKKAIIVRHILRSLNSVTAGSTVRIASWNIKSARLVDATVRAHRRGAGVRVIMARSVAERQVKGGSFDRLKRKLSEGNKNRPKQLRSWARTCKASCRGFGGIAHTKMYLFSRVGTARDVVMVSSANMTEVAATNQWNDIFTVTGQEGLRDKFYGIFDEMGKDQHAPPPYRRFDGGKNLRAFIYPYRGKRAIGDPVVRELKKVRCNGATDGTGSNGRTVVRVAQTAILGERGKRIADRLREMDRRGCQIKIIYAVSDNGVRSRLAGIPVRQYIQDTDGDGVYDRYLHMKSMTVNGVYNGDTSARVVWNGSANWSPKALDSDEAGFRVARGKLQRRYSGWINRLFKNPPPSRTSRTQSAPSARVTQDGQVVARLTRPDGTVVNPYKKIQLN